MKRILFSLIIMASLLPANAQNTGIGTSSPQARLHVKSDFEITRLQGTSPYLSFFNNSDVYTGYLWNRNSNSMDLGTPAGSNFPVTISPNNNPVATFLANGNVGIGVSEPQYRLDINGRIRIRSGGDVSNTAGIWFNNSFNTATPGFVGMYDDNIMGFYGSGAGWTMLMSTNTGNISIGNGRPNSSRLAVGNNSGGNALEVNGPIKVSGSAPAAFRLVASASNITDFNSSGDRRALLVDHPLANGDPNAMLFITTGNMISDVSFRVYYDAALAKWKIVGGAINITGNSNVGSFLDCNRNCTSVGSVATGRGWGGFSDSNYFNVIIIKQ